MKGDFPETLQEAVSYFANGDTAFEFMVSLRWPRGVVCPRCGASDVHFIKSRKLWECKHCKEKKQFSVKVGTIFEDSPIPLSKWLCAVWMIANDKNGVSSYEVHRALGVTQKTAWFMMHRIRLAMQSNSFEKLQGEVEADETYIGGKVRNMHVNRQRKNGRGTGGMGKAIVMGLLERKGRVVARVLQNNKRVSLHKIVHEYVLKGSSIMTDALRSYNGLSEHYNHEAIDHAVSYVRGRCHTNGLENFWSLLKRSIKGTYISVEPFHLFRYLDEQMFRFNERKDDDGGRFLKAVSGVVGKRVRYDELTGKTDAVSPTPRTGQTASTWVARGWAN